MQYDGLTEEQRERARAAKTPEELVALAKEEGVELTDEQLEAVSGGSWKSCTNKAPCDDCRTPFGR